MSKAIDAWAAKFTTNKVALFAGAGGFILGAIASYLAR